MLRLLAAAVALRGPAEGLTATWSTPAGDESSGGLQASATPREKIQAWLDEAAKANEALEEETKAVMGEIAGWIREDPKAKKEQELAMLEELLAKWDTENETRIDETARRMAAIAFRRELRALFAWPHHAAQHRPAPAEPSPEMDDGMKRWLEEANKASEELEKEVSEEEHDLAEEVPKSEEEKGLEKLQGVLDSVDPKNATEMSEVGESLVTKEFRRMAELRGEWPWSKRHRRMRRAPPATKKQRAMVAQQMDDWLRDAMKEEQDTEEKYTSVDNELLDQMNNITREQEQNVIPEADQELAILQGIWEKYELDNENTTAMDLLDKLYPDVSTWYEDALERLHPMNATESAEVAELRKQVESLKADLEKAMWKAKAAKDTGSEPPMLKRKALRRRAVEVLAGLLRAHQARLQASSASSGLLRAHQARLQVAGKLAQSAKKPHGPAA